MKRQEQGFAITQGKGFSITFEHGTTISVQFGRGNYCRNKEMGNFDPPSPSNGIYQCPNAEIAIWNAEGKWVTKQFNHIKHDDVEGWCSPEHVAKAIAWTVKYDKKYSKKLAFIENCETCDYNTIIDGKHYCDRSGTPDCRIELYKIHICPLDEKEDK